MSDDKIISSLVEANNNALKTRLRNVNRHLARDPADEDANCLRSAILEELSRRKMTSRKKVGSLWWEPHDPDVPEFFAYQAADSTTPVAAIFKSDTHTATRKEVYSVRIGNQRLPDQFSEVEIARRAGSEAWEKRNCL